MKKVFSIFLIYALVIISLVPIIPLSSVQAQNNDKVVYQDGEYDLPFEIWKSDEDATSATDGYVKKPAKLFVQDGKYRIQISLNNPSWWQYFKVESSGNGEFKDVEIISEDANQRIVEFPVEDVNEILNAKIHIKFSIQGLDYDHYYEIRIKFDTSQLPVASEEEPEPEEPTNPGQPEEPGDDNKATPIQIKENEEHIIEFRAMHAEEDKDSAMARYLNNQAKLISKNGKVYVTLTIKDHKTVTGFQIENNGELVNPIKQRVDDENNTREATYELNQLLDTMKARVQYQVGQHSGDQPLRLVFNTETITSNVQWVNLGASAIVEAGKTVRVPNANVAVTMPNDLPAGTNIKLELIEGKNIPETGENLKVAGSVIDVTLTFPPGHENYQGKYTLTLPYDKNNYAADKISIYYFNEDKEEWEKQQDNSEVDSTNGTVSVDVNHFSTYGVLANVSAPNNNNGGNSGNNGNAGNNNNNSGNQPPSNVAIDPKNLKDGVYTIDFTVLKDNTNQPSVMDGFVEKPAYLRVKNGIKYIAMTFTSSSYVLDFKVEQNGQLVSPKVLQVDAENDKRTVEFTVNDLYQKLNAWVHVNIPGLYNSDYDVQIAFDPDSIRVVSNEQEYPTTDPDAKQKLRNITNNQNHSDDSLSFNRNDGTDGKGSGDKSAGANPKTADKTKLFLYVSLLVASLIPLAIQLRKKLRSTNV